MIGNPSFALSFGLEDIKKLVSETLKKKDWHTFKHSDITLSFVPYFIFYYDSFSEEEKGGEKKISGTKRGRLALNAVSGKIDMHVSQELAKAKESKKMPEIKVKMIKPEMNPEEAKKIAEIKASEILESHPQKILISNLRLFYYPLWTLGIEVEEGNFELQVSGTSGKIFGEEKIPERKKGLMELTSETLNELKSPGAWGKYSIETVKTLTGSDFLKNKWLIIIVLVLILIAIIILWP